MAQSTWKTTRTTIPQTDAGYAVTVLTTGDRPRKVTQLAVWSGTNTAAPVMVVGSIQAVPGDVAINQYTVASSLINPLGASSATLNAGSVENPLVMIPMGQKGYYSFEGFLLPPNSNLVVWPADANLNGTAVVSTTSFEV